MKILTTNQEVRVKCKRVANKKQGDILATTFMERQELQPAHCVAGHQWRVSFYVWSPCPPPLDAAEHFIKQGCRQKCGLKKLPGICRDEPTCVPSAIAPSYFRGGEISVDGSGTCCIGGIFRVSSFSAGGIVEFRLSLRKRRFDNCSFSVDVMADGLLTVSFPEAGARRSISGAVLLTSDVLRVE